MGFLTRLIGGYSATEMKKDSRYLQSLSLPNVPTLTVEGEYDFVVREADIKKDPTTDNIKHIQVPASHLTLITSERVFQEVISWLTYDILDSLGFEGKGRAL